MPTRVSWKLNLGLLWFSQILVIAGFFALIPFIPLFIKNELGVTNESDLAVAISAFNFSGALAYAVFIPIWGMMADRTGVKPILLRGTFITAIIFPLMTCTQSVWMLVLLRFISAGCAGTTAASQMMIVRNTPDDKQGFALGVLATSYWGGAMLGNVIGGLIIHYFNYEAAFWFCGILYFIGGFAVIFTRDGAIKAAGHIKSAAAKRQWNIRSLIPALTVGAWIMSILFLLMGTIRNFEVPYVALHIETLTDPQEAALWTGIASAVFCGAAIIAGVFSGYIADKIPPLKILIPIMLISSASLLVQGFANNLWVFIISRSVLYTAAGGLQPVLQKVLTTITPQRKRGTVFGFASAGSSIGNMLSAVLGGAAYSLTSARGVFIITGVLYFLSMPAMIKGVLTAGKPFVFKRKTTLFGNSNRQTAKV